MSRVPDFQALVENATDVLYAVDETGNVTYVNAAVEAMFGWRPEEILGKNLFLFVHPDSHAEVKRQIAARATGAAQTAQYEAKAVRKDGSSF